MGMGGRVRIQLGKGKGGRMVLQMRTVGQIGGSAGRRHERRGDGAFGRSLGRLGRLGRRYNKAQVRQPTARH